MHKKCLHRIADVRVFYRRWLTDLCRSSRNFVQTGGCVRLYANSAQHRYNSHKCLSVWHSPYWNMAMFDYGCSLLDIFLPLNGWVSRHISNVMEHSVSPTILGGPPPNTRKSISTKHHDSHLDLPRIPITSSCNICLQPN